MSREEDLYERLTLRNKNRAKLHTLDFSTLNESSVRAEDE